MSVTIPAVAWPRIQGCIKYVRETRVNKNVGCVSYIILACGTEEYFTTENGVFRKFSAKKAALRGGESVGIYTILQNQQCQYPRSNIAVT
jgi:hypothetical protein